MIVIRGFCESESLNQMTAYGYSAAYCGYPEHP